MRIKIMCRQQPILRTTIQMLLIRDAHQSACGLQCNGVAHSKISQDLIALCQQGIPAVYY